MAASVLLRRSSRLSIDELVLSGVAVLLDIYFPLRFAQRWRFLVYLSHALL